MKKLLGIVVLGLLLSGNANSASIFDHLNYGMTKKQVSKIINKSSYENLNEIDGYLGQGICYVGFRDKAIYYSNIKIEINTHYNPNLKNAPWYVFENVTKPVKFSLGICKNGNGTLKAITFSREDAIKVAKGQISINSKNFAKIFTQKESINISSKSKNSNTTSTSSSSSTNDKISQSKKICKELGFKANSEKFADCALRMMSLQFEAGSKVSNNDGSSTQKIIVQQQDDFDLGDFFFGLQKIVDDNYRTTNNSSSTSSTGQNCRIYERQWGAEVKCK
mgnify:CR=1 FL=1